MRPLVVLLLVLAAIGALILGVLAFLKEPAPTDTGPATVIHGPENPAPTPQPIEALSGDPRAPDRAPTATDTNPTGSQSGPAAIWQYANTLVGVVQNPQGKPLPGCEVSLGTWRELIFVNDVVDRSQDQIVRTNEEGRYTFRNLEPRDGYQITVRYPEFARNVRKSVPIGEEGEFEEPPIVLAPGAVLQGHVRDEGGNAVDKAALVLDGLEYQGGDGEPPDRMTTTTDNEGWYAFPNVQEGQRVLTVTASGYGSVTLHGLNFTGKETAAINRDIALKVGEMMRGRVVCDGKGIPGATVLAFGITQQGSRTQAVTDAAGEFTLDSLTPGEYSLTAHAKGYRFDPLTRQKSNTDNVVIQGTRQPDVCGHVVDAATGEPLTNFNCRLRTSQGQGQLTIPTDMPPQSFQDPKGEFCLVGVPPGEYVVEAQAPGYAPAFSAPVSVAVGHAPPPTTVRASRGASVRGRVIDPDGKPVAKARVTTHDKDWTDDAFTQIFGGQYPTVATSVDIRAGEDGRFVIGGLTPETYQINIRAAGFTRYVKTGIEVQDGKDTNLGDIKLQRGGTLSGTLYGPDGKPVVGGPITLSPNEGNMAQTYSTKSGMDGKFTIANVAPGRYQLSAARPPSGNVENPFDKFVDAGRSQQMVTIAEGTTTNQQVTLAQ